MTIVVNGIPQLDARLLGAAVLGEAALKAAIDGIGMAVEQGAKELVPVLTGDLQDSITYEDGRVYTNVIYAGKVEYGGLHNPPEPYMRPAADTVDATEALGAAKVVMDSA
jgi:hypothetical protein